MEKKQSKAKKGFTLAEMSVAMAIIAVAMAMLALCFVSINTFAQKKEKQTEILSEVSSFKESLNIFLQDLKNSNNELIQNLNLTNYIEMQTPTGIIKLEYKKSNSCIIVENTQQTIFEFKYIEDVKFSTYNNLIKCKINYEKIENIIIFNI